MRTGSTGPVLRHDFLSVMRGLSRTLTHDSISASRRSVVLELRRRVGLFLFIRYSVGRAGGAEYTRMTRRPAGRR